MIYVFRNILREYNIYNKLFIKNYNKIIIREYNIYNKLFIKNYNKNNLRNILIKYILGIEESRNMILHSIRTI